MPQAFQQIFGHTWPLLGVVHLAALPGSPFNRLALSEIRDLASADAEAIIGAGFDGLVVENFGDYPFMPEHVEPHTIAAMALLCEHVRDVAIKTATSQPPIIGVNVLRNDALAGLAVAAMTGAHFIRVNVHVGAMVTDQGILQGKAHETLRYRSRLGAKVAILADVLVKHAHPLGTVDLEGIARDTILRGGADALILSGRGTGEPTDFDRAIRIRKVLPEAPLLIGSGLTLETLERACLHTDGAIIGTALKRGGQVENPVEGDRARAFVEARSHFRGNV